MTAGCDKLTFRALVEAGTRRSPIASTPRRSPVVESRDQGQGPRINPGRDTMGSTGYYTYGSIKAEIGEKNALLTSYDPAVIKDVDRFIARWKQAYQQK
jgi:hypothetical protein